MKIVIAALALAASIGVANAATVMKVPCRDMGDGRTLLDVSFLPDRVTMAGRGFPTAGSVKILTVRGLDSADFGWANRICTVRVR
jgi:hypothetical protein